MEICNGFESILDIKVTLNMYRRLVEKGVEEISVYQLVSRFCIWKTRPEPARKLPTSALYIGPKLKPRTRRVFGNKVLVFVNKKQIGIVYFH